MPIILPSLPYAKAALEPHISAQTLALHHGKHHRAYVDKTNALAKAADQGEARLEEIVRSAHKTKDDKLFNQAAQAWNHGFYWPSLSPEKTKPSTELGKAITASFGDHGTLEAELIAAATDHFGSGWAWLVSTKGKLGIETTHDAATALTGSSVPLVVIDVWEHAYYLDHHNVRKAYVEAAVKHLLNWDFASENFSRGDTWQYPAS
jgi:superoxide dismutase, Fe-Mn family